jgi:hypothetical protein
MQRGKSRTGDRSADANNATAFLVDVASRKVIRVQVPDLQHAQPLRWDARETTIDGWLASGKGALPPQTCSNGKASDAVCWVIKQKNGIAAKDGIRFVDLTGFNSRLHDRYGSVSQGVPTEVGKRYELSFAIGSSSNFPRGATGLGVTVEIPAIVIPGVTDGIFFAIEISVPPQTVSQWSDHRFRFTARNETTTLIFTGASLVRGAEGDYIGLDNVSLQKVCFIVFAQSDSGCP